MAMEAATEAVTMEQGLTPRRKMTPGWYEDCKDERHVQAVNQQLRRSNTNQCSTLWRKRRSKRHGETCRQTQRRRSKYST